MNKMTNFWERFVQFITFINLPIRKKFLLFEVGTFFWFALVGILCVSSLSFIHYRYTQITQTTLPYTKVIYAISSELYSLEKRVALGEDEVTLLTVKTSITQMKNAIAEAMLKIQKNPTSGNIFEAVINSLSKEDTQSLSALQAISKELNAMEALTQTKIEGLSSVQKEEMRKKLGLHVKTINTQ